jgi:nitrous oxide reductase accessory protein NosL
MRRLLPPIVVLLAGLLLLAACGSAASAAAPPTIHYGVDVADCGMIISDARYAAGLVDQRGHTVLYDDTGELATHVQSSGLGAQDHAWVHDYDSKSWLDATSAFFVASEELRPQTPMGTGVVAFKTRQQSEAFAADHHGTVMSWDELLTQWHSPAPAMKMP